MKKWKKCKKCNTTIFVKSTATKCPHCQSDLICDTDSDNQTSFLKHPLFYSLFFILIVIVFFLTHGSNAKKTTTPKSNKEEKSQIEIKAGVLFTGSQFIIRNSNDFNWYKCKFEVNSGLVRGGYIYKPPMVIEPNETYTIGASQFAKSGGERFNPFTHKAQNFSIDCRDEKENFLFGQQTW